MLNPVCQNNTSWPGADAGILVVTLVNGQGFKSRKQALRPGGACSRITFFDYILYLLHYNGNVMVLVRNPNPQKLNEKLRKPINLERGTPLPDMRMVATLVH